mgnify:FL=1
MMLANTTNTSCISDGLYKILFDYAADSMFMLDRQGRVKLVNKRVENILGYNTGDLKDKKLDFIILKPYRNMFNKALKESIQHEVDTIEIDVQTKMGKVLNMELDITGVKQNGKYFYTQVHFRDVSRRKKADDEIRYLNDYLETILGNLECFVRVLNPKGNVLYVNKAYKKRFGREAGERCYSVWDKKLPCKECIAEKAVKYFKSQRKEEILQTGEVYDTIAIPLKNRDGTISAIEVITDVTMARGLEQQKTLIGNIIHTVASDIDIRNVYKTVAEELLKLIQFDRAAIVVIKEDGKHIEIFSLWSGYKRTSVDVGIYPLEGTALEEIVKTNKFLLVEEVAKSRFWTLKKLAKEGIRTFLAAPLLYKGRCVGGITISSKRNRAFTDRDIGILESIAPHIAIAVANTSLYIQVKNTQEELKTLNVQIIRQNIELEEINKKLGDTVRERTKHLEKYITTLDANLNLVESFTQIELTEEKIYMQIARELLTIEPDDGKYTHLLIFFCEKGTPKIEGHMFFSKGGAVLRSSDIIKLEGWDQIVLNQRVKRSLFFNYAGQNIQKPVCPSGGDKSKMRFPEINKIILEKVGKIRNGVMCKIKDIGGNIGLVATFNADKEVSEHDVKVLETYCITLEFLKSIHDNVEELHKTYDNTLTIIANAAELRDAVTGSHIERVKHYCVEIGKKLGYTDSDLVHLKWGAILHDIGKLGIPDSVLLKKGILNYDEMKIMKEHTIIGANFIETLGFLKRAKYASLYHHERYDGTGYPKGLKGEQIPLDARIVAIADVYDAMTSERPYRKAISNEEVDRIIKENAGSQFDPRVVNAFFDIKDKILEIKQKYIG